MNRIVEVSSSLGQKKCYEYDVLGNVIAMTDALGNRTTYEYTMSGKLSAVTDAVGNRTVYAYDVADNLTYICQQGKEGEADRVTVYERDALGNLLTVKDALDGEEHYRYDALGRLLEKTDRDGFVTAYTYTKAGQTSRILYGDGKSVEMEYDVLRRLTLVKDWLGETKIERDRVGRITSITDHEDKKVAYEWGSMGERTSITYPDGKKVSYRYDELLRLTAMEIPGEKGGEEIHYLYDEAGRLKEKQLPGGIRTFWGYNEMGLPAELTHEDEQGILDKYRYTYDLMGNKTGITRERRGLREESGSYGYAYDALGRLAQVTKDGNPLRSYRYDTFSNRTETEDYQRGIRSAFTYDARNQMLAMEETLLGNMEDLAGNMEASVTRRTYDYDGRGNLTGERENGELLHGYEYGAINRLTRAHNSKGEEALYFYNGLGQRVGREAKGERDTYLLDLTKAYHNLLSINGKDKNQTFYWDNNVTAMEEGGDGLQELHYYLQDELGSPLRVSTTDGYLTYGYDEFGNDLGEELERAGIPNPYTRQGDEQPFGYTGYRYDNISNTYFAQAREYKPESGRFTAEDVIRDGLNWYIYCYNNGLRYIDYRGLESYVFYTTGKDSDFTEQAKWKKEQLEMQGEKVVLIPVASAEDFIDGWKEMGIIDGEVVDINNVEIYTHGTPNTLIFVDGSTTEAVNISGINSIGGNITKVSDLEAKEINVLNLYACNAGSYLTYINEGENIALEFSKIVHEGVVYAYDGNVGFGKPKWKFWSDEEGYEDRLSTLQFSYERITRHYNTHARQRGKIMYVNGEYVENTDVIVGFNDEGRCALA